MIPTIYELSEGVEVHLYPDWIENPEAAFREAEKLSWGPEVVTMYAKPSVIRRRTVDYGLGYTYNATAKPSVDWEPLPRKLQHKLEAQFGIDWPQCACNEYVDEDAYIGCHHDKDTVVDGEKREPLYIASISLGAMRRMVLTPPGANLKVSMTVTGLMGVPGAVGIDLPSGSLLLFSNATNRTVTGWKHAVPKARKGEVGKRISLTYRHF
jgi:alkylated DNA repair dioxygenase AlkB